MTVVEKEKAELSTKLKKVEDEANQVDVHLRKKQIVYDLFTAKQRFNEHINAQAERKKKNENKSWVKSITSGYQHGGGLGGNFAFSSSEVSFVFWSFASAFLMILTLHVATDRL